MRVVAMAVSLLACGPAAAWACGHCLEDRMAATYDYAVMTRAAAAHHEVAFAELRGARAGETVAALRRALAAAPGVDPGTARVSLEPAAVSFAFDPARSRLEAVVRGINRRLAPRGATIVPIATMSGPSAPVKRLGALAG